MSDRIGNTECGQPLPDSKSTPEPRSRERRQSVSWQTTFIDNLAPQPTAVDPEMAPTFRFDKLDNSAYCAPAITSAVRLSLRLRPSKSREYRGIVSRVESNLNVRRRPYQILDTGSSSPEKWETWCQS